MNAETLASIFDEVKVARLRREDILVFRTNARISAETEARVRNIIQETTGHENVLVLDNGCDIALVRPEPGFFRRIYERLRGRL